MRCEIQILGVLSFLLFSTISGALNGQANFVMGYIISEDGVQKECLINNVDWKNNPVQFEYKLSDNSEILRGDLSGIREFGINGEARYRKFTVDFDNSNVSLLELSENREPEFIKKTGFLKYIVEGKESLLHYVIKGIERFYFLNQDGIAEPLIYKKYFYKGLYTKVNETYKQQLINFQNCNSSSKNRILKLSYSKRSLIGYYVALNECIESSFVNFDLNDNRQVFNASVKVGLSSIGLDLYEVGIRGTEIFSFPRENSFRVGVELEFVFPFNNNRWAVTIDPNVQKYNSSTQNTTGDMISADYLNIAFPLGLRHYWDLNKSMRLALGVSIVFNHAPDSFIGKNRVDAEHNIEFGLGLEIKSRYKIELLRGLRRELFRRDSSAKTDFKSFSFLVGYKFL